MQVGVHCLAYSPSHSIVWQETFALSCALTHALFSSRPAQQHLKQGLVHEPDSVE